VTIRLCNDIVDWMKGHDEVAEAMAKELGITMGETTADGAITLTAHPLHRHERSGAGGHGQPHGGHPPDGATGRACAGAAAPVSRWA
jgi:hypothetical protein